MSNNCICQTPCGLIQGKPAQPGVTAYRGIRYATAGRWQYPKLVTHWDGTYNATQFGPNAMQTAAVARRDNPPGFYEREFRLGLPYTWSEDCQYLNIYAPDSVQNAPVIVYIHGGAYMGGSGWDKVFDEPIWPEHGVIAVTLNYRLGIFGSVVLPELLAESGHAGNYNLYDQMAAVQWVYDNIAAFGGDPGNITLMGQSAGAHSVQMLVASPRMKGIVKQAVLSSGGGVPSHLFNWTPTVEEALGFWQEWKQTIGAADMDTLRAMSADTLMGSLGTMMDRYGFHKVISFVSPFYDGTDFPIPGTSPDLPGGWLEIPYLCGGNTEDIVPGLAKDAFDWTAKQPVSSYAYTFARHLPGDEYGAWHSADLWYWFGTLPHCWRPFGKNDYALRDIMVKYLINFANCGDPNGLGLPHWPAAQQSRDVLWLNEQCCLAPAPEPEQQKGVML